MGMLVAIPLYSQNYADTEIISIQKTRENIIKLQDLHLDLLMEKDGKIFIVAHTPDLVKLQEEQILYHIETSAFPPYGSNSAAIQGGINGQFHSYQEVERELEELVQTYPQIARLEIIGKSLENRNIYALKISDNVSSEESVSDSEPEVIFLGCHHAREWISVEVPLLLGKFLVQNYSNDSRVQTLVDSSETWIIPLVNPDGLEYSIYFYRYWRKNRRNNGDGTYGVDLNRNYGYKWGLDERGSSSDTQNETYRGREPFSEPESQAVASFISAHDFKALVSYHNYSQVILYPWGHTSEPAPDVDLLDKLAGDMSALIKIVYNNEYPFGQSGEDLYVTNGTTTDWAYGTLGIPSFLIELPPVDFLHGGFFNAEAEIQTIFEENLPAALYLIYWAVDKYKPETSQKRFKKTLHQIHNLKKGIK